MRLVLYLCSRCRPPRPFPVSWGKRTIALELLYFDSCARCDILYLSEQWFRFARTPRSNDGLSDVFDKRWAKEGSSSVAFWVRHCAVAWNISMGRVISKFGWPGMESEARAYSGALWMLLPTLAGHYSNPRLNPLSDVTICLSAQCKCC